VAAGLADVNVCARERPGWSAAGIGVPSRRGSPGRSHGNAAASGSASAPRLGGMPNMHRDSRLNWEGCRSPRRSRRRRHPLAR
jgi:hypothetical protein